MSGWIRINRHVVWRRLWRDRLDRHETDLHPEFVALKSPRACYSQELSNQSISLVSNFRIESRVAIAPGLETRADWEQWLRNLVAIDQPLGDISLIAWGTA